MNTLFCILLAAFVILTPCVMLVVTWRDEREMKRKFFSHERKH